MKEKIFNTSSSETAVPNKTVILDYSYYLGRIDRVYLTKDGVFEIKKGEPAEYPKAPVNNSGAFEVGIIDMKPYVFNATLIATLE